MVRPTDAEIEKLVTNHMGLVGYFARKKRRPANLTYDEYWSELLLAIYRSAQTYDWQMGPFSSYAYQGMRWQRQELFVRQNRKKTTRMQFGFVGEGEVVRDFAAPEIRCLAVDRETNNLVSELLASISKNHQIVVKHRLDGLTFKEIADLVGAKSHQAIAYRFFAALKELRHAAEKKGITAQTAGL